MTIEVGASADCSPCDDCGGTCEPFSGTTPTSVQGELNGNSYNSVLTPSGTTQCCDGWPAWTLVQDDYASTLAPSWPDCFPAGFTSEELNSLDYGCVKWYAHGDHVCKNPSFPLEQKKSRDMAAWIAKHPTTGHVWIFVYASLREVIAGVDQWRVDVQGSLDTGLTELVSGSSGPFDVPLDSSCTYEYRGGSVRIGCWNTTLGNIRITP